MGNINKTRGDRVNKYKFSVIIPIYNVEEYIDESIKSVINQNIGFENNIQLILVNDGSPDNCEQICLKYKNKYPDNIIYIKQKNAGVSAARNNGLKRATGELVNFLDSDDKWSNDSFKNVWKNYCKYNDIAVFTTKMCFFDAKKGNHILNYKYNKDKIVDIRNDTEYIQLSTCSCFIKNTAIKGHSYNLKIRNEEDTRLINEILLENCKMMVLQKPTYYYRKRQSVSSASQTSINSKSWYTITPNLVYKYLFAKSQEKFGKVLDYFKYLVAYDIQWRLRIVPPKDLLSKKEINDYIKIINELINGIDLNIFLKQKSLTNFEKLYLMNLKKNKDHDYFVHQKQDKMEVTFLENKKENINFLMVDNIVIRNQKMYLYARFNEALYDKNKLKIKSNGKLLSPPFYELKTNYDELSFDSKYIKKYIGIKYIIDLNKPFRFGFVYDDNETYLSPSFSNQCVLTNLLKGSYFVCDNIMLTFTSGEFVCQNKSISLIVKRELKNMFGLIKDKKIKVFGLRYLVLLSKIIPKRNVWLLSDRINKADDNAEHLFRYILKNKHNINPYYVISKESDDYKRLKKIGKVIDPTSLKYKFLFHHAEFIASSHAEGYITNIYGKKNQYYRDLFKQKFIFLQHGITQNDLSSWINPNTRNIDMIVTVANKEAEAFENYGYPNNVVKLTGFPRYDALKKKQKNINPLTVY